jgi:hypothetical protein
VVVVVVVVVVGMAACTALSVFRRDPAANRYVDAQKFGVFNRVELSEDETVSQPPAIGCERAACLAG